MKLLWLDLETTGLDPQRDRILEVYAALTDLTTPFMIEREIHRVVRYLGDPATLDPFVRDMHTASGLFAECADSRATLDLVHDDLLELLPETTDELTTLAGRSVHFDLGFIRAHMPFVAKRLNYRVLDVSAVEVFLRTMGMQKLEKAKAHRAKADVEESMRHALACREYIRELRP